MPPFNPQQPVGAHRLRHQARGHASGKDDKRRVFPHCISPLTSPALTKWRTTALSRSLAEVELGSIIEGKGGAGKGRRASGGSAQSLADDSQSYTVVAASTLAQQWRELPPESAAAYTNAPDSYICWRHVRLHTHPQHGDALFVNIARDRASICYGRMDQRAAGAPRRRRGSPRTCAGKGAARWATAAAERKDALRQSRVT